MLSSHVKIAVLLFEKRRVLRGDPEISVVSGDAQVNTTEIKLFHSLSISSCYFYFQYS